MSPHDDTSAATTSRILEQRAQLLAQPQSAPQSAETLFCIVFRLADALYAIESKFAQGSMRLQQLCQLPQTPDFIHGIANINGKVYPVLDLRPIYKLPKTDIAKPHVILLHGKSFETALLTEEIIGPQRVKPNLAYHDSEPRKYLSASMTENLFIIDGDRKSVV